MTELAMLSTTGIDFAKVDPGTRIVAVRADGGDAEIRGSPQGSGAEMALRIAPTDRDLGWVMPPEDVVWSGFRTTQKGATCHIQLAPLEDGV
jgi:hypothetical protein